MVNVDLTKVVAADEFQGEDEKENFEVRQMLEVAKTYLASFAWSKGVMQDYVGIAVGGVLGVFLFKITPKDEKVDEWVWVVTGDVPQAYITAESAPNPACALDAYIGAMEEWVQAVKSGRPVKDLIPVGVSPSLKNAENLERRLSFVDREILSRYLGDLRK